MIENNYFSQKVSVFHGKRLPEKASVVGYAAIIDTLGLPVPMPHTIALISEKHKTYQTLEWKVFTPRHQPEETLYQQLVFALKYEGVNLLFFKKLFEKLPEKEIVALLKIEVTGQYTRKIWFIFEWLMQKQLPIPNLTVKNYIPLIENKLQYGLQNGIRSSRHRIINNLPGTINFCPLIRKTEKLENYIKQNIKEKKLKALKGYHKDLLQRTAAFLLLKDSKASFTIEGESPKSKRTARWGRIIGQAGTKKLTREELLRLQQEVIENTRFVKMGFRKQGGFVGEHNRTTGEPIPEHISAKWQDIPLLIEGLINTNSILVNSETDAILAATSIAFGFVFIHPFEDGNGRIHRYLIHHTLAEKQFTQQGLIFPVSASILDHIVDYRKTLEQYSNPVLDFIDWKETKDHNIEVVNETIDYYRYFDATAQAEFLYDCVNDTIENIIPQEITYLQKYDTFKNYLDEEFEMPDRMIALLVRFLEQNEGKISKRAKEKEFNALSKQEIDAIEKNYRLIF
ncbi:MAG: cell filamentation protein Fic [Chlorobi bacterium]|nr:cell filamentation protein Fic [Chlorobiota bacterium]